MSYETDNPKPGLSAKVLSAAWYGLIGGALNLLPLVPFIRTGSIHLHLKEWSNTLSTVGMVAGALYGWNRPEQKYLEQKNHALEIETAVLKTRLEDQQTTLKSWAAQEVARGMTPTATQQTR